MSTVNRRTSFYSLTGESHPDADTIDRVEIPHFQRDYAQGRENENVKRIRTDFLDVLLAATNSDDAPPVGLDFVYGGVEDGTLRPLDGQQRLTTLFLLHWYIACRSDRIDEDHGWKRFSYATRQSARMFCERLVEAPLPHGEAAPSEWITDQSWYLFVWRHDPTIQSMLVMLDAIHERFRHVDAQVVWTRLTATDDPAVWFLLLPLDGLGSDTDQMKAEDLYIKMNSRGKPLTEFENFKAHFEKTIRSSPRATEFAFKVDTTWSDLLWQLRGDDDLVDDEFMRYLEFVTEICEWREGRDDGAGRRLGLRTQEVFGEANPKREEHLDFLFRALDIWVGRDIPETFRMYFTSTGRLHGDVSKVRLFFRDGSQDDSLNLFETCCRTYGATRGAARVFSLGQTLVLYAVLLHLMEDTDDFPPRVRILRNLVEASEDELRPAKMPKLIEDVHQLIRHGAVGSDSTFNKAQVVDETFKVAFLEENQELRRVVAGLEDHDLLHGSLVAFDYDAATFESRALAFYAVMSRPDLWSTLLRALLAVGEYQRQRSSGRQFLFGTDSNAHRGEWRELLTGATRERLQPTRYVMAKLFDMLSPLPVPLEDTLTGIVDGYLARCEEAKHFDWRYYMVKYPSMQEDGSSTYVPETTDAAGQPVMGYSLCKLRAGGRALNGKYRDPYLLAISQQLDDPTVVEDKWFTGYESNPRRLPLTRSRASVRCIPQGFELSAPEGASADAFLAICEDLGVGPSGIVTVPQVEVDGQWVDTVDRIQRGAELVRQLVAAGL